MEVLLLALSVLALVGVAAVIVLMLANQRQNESLRTHVNDQLNEVNRQLLQATGQIGDRLDGASRIIAGVAKGLGEMGEASRQIYDIGKDIASLQDILQPPKLRGILGEVLLMELLKESVPNACRFQHPFRSGEKVDAVIVIGDRLIPIDAKFPLENYKKATEGEENREQYRKLFISDVKKHVDAISKKYILPDEGTYDFAMMYIPAESIYYEIIAKDGDSGLSSYALDKRVIPVSPSTMYSYLQVIIMGLRGLQVEQHAEEIINRLARLRGDFDRFAADFDVLGNHIANAAKKYDEAGKRLSRFNDKLALSEDVHVEADTGEYRIANE